MIKPITYQVSKRVPLKVADGDHIKVGTQLVEGSVDPKKILTILASAPPRSTSWRKCTPCTAPRVWISTTSTSRSSCTR